MKCLRCGRTIQDDLTFCEECSQITSQPLEESEFLNTRVQLPNRNQILELDQASGKGKGKNAKKATNSRRNESKPAKGRGGLIAAVIVLSILLLLCVAALAKGVLYFMGNSYTKQQNQIRVAQEENERLSIELEHYKENLVSAEEERSKLAISLAESKRKISEISEELNGVVQTGSETDFTIREMEDQNKTLSEKVSQLTEENKAYSEMIGSLQATVTTYEAQIASYDVKFSDLEAEAETLKNTNTALQKKSDFVDAHVVFVENDGTNYYHKYSCSRFKKSSYWAYSTSLAESKGYTACPYCH